MIPPIRKGHHIFNDTGGEVLLEFNGKALAFLDDHIDCSVYLYIKAPCTVKQAALLNGLFPGYYFRRGKTRA